MANILWFNQVTMKNVNQVGGKGASLGEMVQNNFPVPNGFVVTSDAYFDFVKSSGIQNTIIKKIDAIDVEDTQVLEETTKEIRALILSTPMPHHLREEIMNDYDKLNEIENNGANTYVAVRSSATAEDLPEASFAGQQDTYLNILGKEALLDAVRRCWASLFTSRAVYYRKKQGFVTEKVGLCAVVQKMVNSVVSGIMFTAEPTGDLDTIVIEAGFGLGETIVSGSVTPDNYLVSKKDLKLTEKKINHQEFMLIRENEKNVEIKLGETKANIQKLNDGKIIELAEIGKKIEEHYKKPMDIEWATEDNKIYIVQARPITTLDIGKNESTEKKESQEKALKDIAKSGQTALIEGLAGSPGIVSGVVKVVPTIDDIVKVNKGDILVTTMTSPSWVPVMKKASAIITNEGGRTCFDGETKLLTNKGFLTFKQIHESGFDDLSTLSLNKKTKKVEWKKITHSMKRESEKIEISVSQTGKISHNTLTLTPDHKMINIREAKIIDTKIQDILNNDELLCVAQKIPQFHESTEQNKKLAYLLGGIITDGSIYTSRTHGEVQFIQKETTAKKDFIDYMQNCMTTIYKKSFKRFEKKFGGGTISGRQINGNGTAFRVYSKEIAYSVQEEEQKLVLTLLYGDKEFAYNFLAGVIDGDGSFYNNRIQIYISEENLLQAATVACLKIGIVPQITKNRHIYNFQIVEKINKLLKYTKRIKGSIKTRTIKTRFFSSKQILTKNCTYRIKERSNNNLLVSEEELSSINDENIKSLIQSDLRMQRVIKTKDNLFGDVYNITVEDNHTYLVFTKNLTPLAVNNCHAAIVSRELGVPSVVGARNATTSLKDGQVVTVDGYNGKIYEGEVKISHEEKKITVIDDSEVDTLEKILDSQSNSFKSETLKEKILNLKKEFGSRSFDTMSEEEKNIEVKELKDILKGLSVKVKVNVALPDAAESAAATKADGVGLLRAEHMVTSSGMHPAEFIRQGKENELKNVVKEGIKTVAEKFDGPVWFRTFDARSDEYKELIGGEKELNEDNPMMGWHGIRRDLDKPEMFRAQVLAVKELRQSGIKNVGIMLPFVINLSEVVAAKKIAKDIGLQEDVDFGVMVETPASAWIIDELIPHINFISFGTNDLTQLTLGIDRNNEKVQKQFDEMHPAILKQIEYVIKKCKVSGVTTSICGQAASNPKMVKKLVWLGIDSISANIDAVDTIRKVVMLEEKKKLLELMNKKENKSIIQRLLGK